MDQFNMASETMIKDSTIDMYTSAQYADNPFPYTIHYGGVAVHSLTDGYYIGTAYAPSGPTNIGKNNIRSFPFANAVFKDGLGDLAFNITLTDHQEDHLPAANPLRGATGFGSTDYGFISSQLMTTYTSNSTRDYSGPTSTAPFLSISNISSLEKFPFANQNTVADVFEYTHAIADGNPDGYPTADKRFRSSMGVGGIVS